MVNLLKIFGKTAVFKGPLYAFVNCIL